MHGYPDLRTTQIADRLLQACAKVTIGSLDTHVLNADPPTTLNGSLNMSGLDVESRISGPPPDADGFLDASVLAKSGVNDGLSEVNEDRNMSSGSRISKEASAPASTDSWSGASPASDALVETSVEILEQSSDMVAARVSDESGSENRVGTSTTRLARERGRPRFRDSPIRSRGPRLTARDWSFMPGRRNKRRLHNLATRISYSDEGEVDVPPEKNKKATGHRWRTREARKLKFVDDGSMVSRINMDSGEVVGREGGNL